MKKGLTYVDWAISVGLFIIYLVVLFVVFSPGVKEDYNSEHLTDMVQRNLKEDAYKDMIRIPVYVDVVGVCGPSCKVKLNPFTTDWNPRNTFLVNENFANVDFELDSEPSLKIDYDNFGLGTNTFWLYYFEKRDVLNPGVSCTSSCKTRDDGISYAIGVEEKISGFYGENLTDLENNLNLKEEWNYPISKDFKFSIYNGLDFTRPPIFEKGSSEINQTTQEEVYVMQWSDWLLDENTGTRDPITVKVMVW